MSKPAVQVDVLVIFEQTDDFHTACDWVDDVNEGGRSCASAYGPLREPQTIKSAEVTS